MQDEQKMTGRTTRGMTEGELHTVMNTFTEGLRELPTDYATRVKNFLAEYLVSAHHPVPFGGRVRDFESLDTWLDDAQAPPYLLLAAPAGRGKSALLLRWRQRLLARSDIAAIYFPVSIRFRTNLAGVVFPSLVALLANLHGEKVPADPNLHEDVWRGLLADYMTRPLPDGRPLVLILDGVDEAADWTPGTDLFPQQPPTGLHVVLSARYLANDQDANAWLQRLGWTRPGLAQTHELFPLDRAGIASVLIQMGFPVDLLGSRVDIVSELHRLSEGDPLLIRLYVDDLWERGEAVVRLEPEDLRAIHPGLVGYFERWWKDQRLLWSETAPQSEAAVQTLLSLLAGALGPLSTEDMLGLAPDEAGFNTDELAQHLTSLARFVIGDGMRQGYVFSHPRLANYFFEERLSVEERESVERRFLVWGQQTLMALNEGHVSPQKASAYIVQYYGAHLERSQVEASVLLSLVSDGWRRAWETLDRANAGFLGDVERAWQAAQREDTAAAHEGHAASYLGEEIHCLLCQTSINSVTSNIPPKLMLEAVKTGIWTPAQGLASIRLISDLAPRAQELVELAPFVQEPLRTDILQEALDTVNTIKDDYARLDALVALAPALSEDLLWQVLTVVPSIDDEADRAGLLSELVPAFAHHQALITKALDLALEIEDEEYRALALTGLAPYLPTELHDRVLQELHGIHEERYRAQVLTALVPQLGPASLQDVLQQARDFQDGLSRARLLPTLVSYLPIPLQAEVMQEALELLLLIEDREYRIEVQLTLAPFLPEERLLQALQEVQIHWDESLRARALTDLIPYIPAEHLPTLLHIVQSMKSEEFRTQVLLRLIPRLSEEALAQVLDSMPALWDEGYRVEILAKLAPYASAPLLLKLLETIQSVHDHGYRVWLLAELEALPLVQPGAAAQFDMLEAFEAIKGRDERLHTLLAIVPRLSESALAKLLEFMLPEVFGFTWRIQSEESRAHILAKLGNRLPENQLPKALEMVYTLINETYRVQALVALAPRMQQTLLPEALDIVRAMKEHEKRAQVLEALVASLPEQHKGAKVQEMLEVLQIIKDEGDRAQLITTYAPYLPETLSATRAKLIIKAVDAMRFAQPQAHILVALIPHMPQDMFEDVLDVVQSMHSEEIRVQVLEALAPRVPQALFSSFLHVAMMIRSEHWLTQVLATLMAYVPQHMFAGMLRMARSMHEEAERVNMLAVLARTAPEHFFSQVWEAVQTIKDERRRLWVMGTLALRMPEEFFPPLWQFIQTRGHEGGQAWVLGMMAPHMSEALFSQVWQAVQAIPDEEEQAPLIRILARYVPQRFFPQVWEATQAISDEIIHIQTLEMLAPAVPALFFSEVWQVAEAIERQNRRDQVLEALAPHVPPSFFPEVWETVRRMPARSNRASMLETLAPHVPEPFLAGFLEFLPFISDDTDLAKILERLIPVLPAGHFPAVWDVVQSMRSSIKQAQILKMLLPYIPQESILDVWDLAQALPYGEAWIRLLEALVPYLSKRQCSELLQRLLPPGQDLVQGLEAMQGIGNSRWHTLALAVLFPHLPAQQVQSLFPTVLKDLQVVKSEENRSAALEKLAPFVPENLLPEMLEMLWSLSLEPLQAPVLASLLSSLSEAGWTTVVKQVLDKTRATGNVEMLLQVLKAAETQVKRSSPTLLYPVLQEALHLLTLYTRSESLAKLALLIPAIYTTGGAEAIATACCATLEVGLWWP